MATFQLSFACDNDAFGPGDDGYTRDEIARILRDVARVVDGADAPLELGGAIYDANGNAVGRFEWSAADDSAYHTRQRRRANGED